MFTNFYQFHQQIRYLIQAKLFLFIIRDLTVLKQQGWERQQRQLRKITFLGHSFIHYAGH